MRTTRADRLAELGVERARLLAEAEAVTERLRAAIREAVAAGMSEVEAARLAGVTRMTVRSWLGKS